MEEKVREIQKDMGGKPKGEGENEETSELDKIIMFQEVLSNIRKMKAGKRPGEDGIPIEFITGIL